MILYQLCKWMEERAGLKKRIREGSGDAANLLHMKDKVEQRMLRQTSVWIMGIDEAMEPIPALEQVKLQQTLTAAEEYLFLPVVNGPSPVELETELV